MPNPKPIDATKVFGRSVRLSQMPVTSPYSVGFFSSFARGWDYAWEDVQNRWASMGDDGGTVSANEFENMIGDRPIKSEWFPGMTRGLAGRLIDEHEHAKWAAQFDTSATGQFLGAIGPSLLDPVSVATMPIGGFGGITAATSLTSLLKSAAIAGVKTSAASVVPEAVIEQHTYGEIRPGMFALSVAAPIFATPVLAGFARGAVAFGRKLSPAGRVTDGQLGRGIAENPQTRRFDDVEDTAHRVENNTQAATATPPPRPQFADQVEPTPRTRVTELFDGYGGTGAWLRDFASGDERAIQFARDNNIDPDSPALRTYVAAEANRQAVVNEPNPSVNATQLQNITQWVQGQAERPPFTRNPAFRALEQQLRTPNQTRQGLEPVGDFLANGADRTITNHASALHRQMEAVINNPGLAPNTRRSQMRQLQREFEETNDGPRTITQDYDEVGFLAAVDAARLTSTIQETGSTPPATILPSPVIEDDLAAFAREHGVSEEEIANTAGIFERVEAAMRGCGGN